MHRRLAVFLVAAAAVVAPASARSSWPIDDFEVYQGAPWDPESRTSMAVRVARMFGIDTDHPLEAHPPLTPSMKAELEAFLHGAALKMQEWDLPPPTLHPVVERADGGRAFRVYYATLSDVSGLYSDASVHNPFVPLMNALFLDAENITNGQGDVTAFGFAVVAHELFHAVQASTAYLRRLERQGWFWGAHPWIIEGQADAVGYDVAQLVRGEDIIRGNTANKLWGKRLYSLPLPVEYELLNSDPSTTAYRTSSWWRYLAERYSAIKAPRHATWPGADRHPVHYGYLAKFLARATPGSGTAAELDWLDAMTRSTDIGFKAPLRDIFADFAAAYAGYGAGRVWQGDPVGDRALTGRMWRHESFRRHEPSGSGVDDGCWKAKISPSERRAAVPFRILENAAACFDLTVEGFPTEVSVDVQLNTLSLEGLSQLGLGVAGDRRTAVEGIRGVDRDTVRTHQAYRVSGRATTTFVVSNVAPTPSKTVAQLASIVFVLGGKRSNFDPGDYPGPLPPDPTELLDVPPRKATEDRMKRAEHRPTADGPLTAQLYRRPEEDALVIQLRTVPDALQARAEVNGPGSVVGQLLATGDLSRREDGELTEIIHTAEAIRQRDGAEIEIRIPLVDYGFSGQVDEAVIEVSRYDQGALEAAGPVDADPGPAMRFPPSGHVVVDELSPEFMSGSFWGELIDPADILSMSDGPRPTAPIVRSIRGRFWIGSPWINDDRVEITGPEDPFRRTAYDLLAIAPAGAAPLIEEAVAAAKEGRQADYSRPAPSSASHASGCDCTCEGMRRMQEIEQEIERAGREPTAEEKALAGCVFTCMAQYAACEE